MRALTAHLSLSLSPYRTCCRSSFYDRLIRLVAPPTLICLSTTIPVSGVANIATTKATLLDTLAHHIISCCTSALSSAALIGLNVGCCAYVKIADVCVCVCTCSADCELLRRRSMAFTIHKIMDIVWKYGYDYKFFVRKHFTHTHAHMQGEKVAKLNFHVLYSLLCGACAATFFFASNNCIKMFIYKIMFVYICMYVYIYVYVYICA